jgi:hypothetical protein
MVGGGEAASAVPLGNISGLAGAIGGGGGTAAGGGGGAAAGGGAVGGTVAGGTAIGTLGILAAAGLIAVGATIAIDCYANGECIWTTVSNAGGWGVVLGISPNPSAQPIPGAVTVNCSDPTPLATQCQNSSLKNSITGYSSWFGGAFWTCGEIWADGSTTGSASWMAALNSCNAQVATCVAATMNVCQQNNIPRADLQPLRLDMAVAVAN